MDLFFTFYGPHFKRNFDHPVWIHWAYNGVEWGGGLMVVVYPSPYIPSWRRRRRRRWDGLTGHVRWRRRLSSSSSVTANHNYSWPTRRRRKRSRRHRDHWCLDDYTQVHTHTRYFTLVHMHTCILSTHTYCRMFPFTGNIHLYRSWPEGR